MHPRRVAVEVVGPPYAEATVSAALDQLLTLPVGTHMVGRAAERTGQVPDEVHRVDDLAPADSAGDVLRPEDPGR